MRAFNSSLRNDSALILFLNGIAEEYCNSWIRSIDWEMFFQDLFEFFIKAPLLGFNLECPKKEQKNQAYIVSIFRR